MIWAKCTLSERMAREPAGVWARTAHHWRFDAKAENLGRRPFKERAEIDHTIVAGTLSGTVQVQLAIHLHANATPRHHRLQILDNLPPQLR
jgi:hypothetical protein